MKIKVVLQVIDVMAMVTGLYNRIEAVMHMIEVMAMVMEAMDIVIGLKL